MTPSGGSRQIGDDSPAPQLEASGRPRRVNSCGLAGGRGSNVIRPPPAVVFGPAAERRAGTPLQQRGQGATVGGV